MKNRNTNLRIAIGLVALVALVAGFVYGPGYLREREEGRLNTVGTEVPAVILGVEETGNRYNDMSELLYTVEVTPVGAAPYRVSITTVGTPQPGGTPVTVVVDPNDTQSVAFKQ
ncbi:hypothetical protein K2Q16_01370 [Patescibacteria group bacterium]|nr:hypothetical protein [Patescibacteria group bacterium]